jgi:YfiR/HmsC-like
MNSICVSGKVRQRFRGLIFLKRNSLLLLLLIPAPKLYPQQPTDYAIHANIIYHFTKYIDWPGNKKSGDFIIGVTGDTPLYDALKKNIAGKMVGKQKIVITKISSSASSFDCHILFISEEESGSMKKIISRTLGDPILLVSEAEGLAHKGSCINFVIVSDHLKLEFNKNSMDQRNLSIASELLQLGKIVD